MLLFEAPGASCLASETSGSTTLRVRERRVLNLLVEIAPLVVTNKVRADVFIAGAFGGLRLVTEAILERLSDLAMEVHARELGNDLVPQLRVESLIADAQHIQANSVVQQLDFNRLVGRDARRRVPRDRVPRRLDAGVRNPVMLQELAHRIGAVHLEAVVRAAEGFQQAQIMKRRADKQQFRIIRLAGLTAQLIGPEEDTVR